MSFLWSESLWLLLALPMLLVVRWILNWRRRDRRDVSGLMRMHTQRVAQSTWRRRLPPALLMIALVAMLLAVARPTATLTLPSANDVVVLAIDVSGSMMADDLKPTRLEAAREAARAFVKELPSQTRVSIVSFASSASILLPPTRNRVDIENALSRLQTQAGTAMGSAILISLNALFPELEFDMRSREPRIISPPARRSRAPSTGSQGGDADDTPMPTDREPGDQDWAAIVMLSDGQTNAGADTLASAKLAASLGVRVYPVGIGTDEGVVLDRDGWSMRVKLDSEVLQEVADITAGEFYSADDSLDLRQIYEVLSTRLSLETREIEITGLLSALGAFLLLLSAGLSLRWFNRVI